MSTNISTVDDIRNKKVDYNILSSKSSTAINVEEDHGKLNIVIDENDGDTSLYVGSKHIASGYGFDTPQVKQSVEELIANPNIQNLLSKSIETNEEEEEPTEENKYVASSVSLKDFTISIDTTGTLQAESFIDIYNIEITLSNGNKLYEGDNEYRFSMIDSPLYINTIDFDYNVNTSRVISYKLDFTLDGASNDMTLNDGTQLNDLTKDGKNHHYKITGLNIELTKDRVKLNDIYPINIIFTDADTAGITNKMYIFKRICKVVFAYPVFISNSISFSQSATNKLYDELHGVELTLDAQLNNETGFNYIYVPQLLSNPTFIYKKSNIACNFNLITMSMNIGTYVYDQYCSPHEYGGKMTWIIK